MEHIKEERDDVSCQTYKRKENSSLSSWHLILYPRFEYFFSPSPQRENVKERKAASFEKCKIERKGKKGAMTEVAGKDSM